MLLIKSGFWDGKYFRELGFDYVGKSHINQLSEDDEYGTKIFMKNILQYKSVLEMKISDEVKGRRKTMSKIPVEIVDRIYEATQKGLAICT